MMELTVGELPWSGRRGRRGRRAGVAGRGRASAANPLNNWRAPAPRPCTLATPAAPRELPDRQLRHPNHSMDHPVDDPICISPVDSEVTIS